MVVAWWGSVLRGETGPLEEGSDEGTAGPVLLNWASSISNVVVTCYCAQQQTICDRGSSHQRGDWGLELVIICNQLARIVVITMCRNALNTNAWGGLAGRGGGQDYKLHLPQT